MSARALVPSPQTGDHSLEQKLQRLTGSRERLDLLVGRKAPHFRVFREKRFLKRAVGAFFEDAYIREIIANMGDQAFISYLNYVTGREIEPPAMNGRDEVG